jgi:hypothetical protein
MKMHGHFSTRTYLKGPNLIYHLFALSGKEMNSSHYFLKLDLGLEDSGGTPMCGFRLATPRCDVVCARDASEQTLLQMISPCFLQR